MDDIFSNTVGWGELLADTAFSILEGVSLQERRRKKLLDQVYPKIEEYMRQLKNYLHVKFKEAINAIEQSILELQLNQMEYISEKHSNLLTDIQNQSNMYDKQINILRNDLDFIHSLEKGLSMNSISNFEQIRLLDEEINSLYNLSIKRVLELLDVKANR